VRKSERSAKSDMVRRSEDRDVFVGCIRYPPYPLPHQQQQACGQHRTGKSPLPYACIFSLVKEKFFFDTCVSGDLHLEAIPRAPALTKGACQSILPALKPPSPSPPS
jgi:hypothetical protein